MNFQFPMTTTQAFIWLAVFLVSGVASVMLAAKMIDADNTDMWSAIKFIVISWVILWITSIGIGYTPLASDIGLTGLLGWLVYVLVGGMIASGTLGTTLLRGVIACFLASLLHMIVVMAVGAAMIHHNGRWDEFKQSLSHMWSSPPTTAPAQR